jgi:hypothetical protein
MFSDPEFTDFDDLSGIARYALIMFELLQIVSLASMCDKFYTDFKTVSVMPIKKEKAVKIYIAVIAAFTLVINIVYAIFVTAEFSQGSIDIMQFISLLMIFIGCIAVTVTMLCLYTVNFCVYSVKNRSSKSKTAFHIKIQLFYLFFIALGVVRVGIEMPIVFYGIKAAGLIAAIIFALAAVVVSVIVGNRTARDFYL